MADHIHFKKILLKLDGEETLLEWGRETPSLSFYFSHFYVLLSLPLKYVVFAKYLTQIYFCHKITTYVTFKPAKLLQLIFLHLCRLVG